ncbi:MAG TPA: NAD(P)H-binding protein [Streptosporangiaceae bacterium]|jgi:uncharacterized protein YbjT (DUF2867 family)
MILVTGATGSVGRELLARLAAAGEPVRAMSRKPDGIRLPPGAEAVYGDAEDAASLDAAFRGVDAAYLMSAQPVGSAPRPTHILELAAAARRAGTARLVLLSTYLADAGRTDPLSVWQSEAETAVTGSGSAWALLKPGRFMTNVLNWAPMIARGDTVPIPYADLPAVSIDPADIAEIAAAALTTDAYDSTAYQLTGPEALTPREELAVIGAEIDRPLRAVEPPAGAFRAGLMRSGMSEEVVDSVLTLMRDDPTPAEILPTVPRLLGRPATRFADWVTRNRAAFAAG